MRRYLSVLILAGTSLLGCNEPADGYLAASAISRRVFPTGPVFTFAAPTNAVSLTGLYMVLRSSRDIRFRVPGAH